MINHYIFFLTRSSRGLCVANSACPEFWLSRILRVPNSGSLEFWQSRILAVANSGSRRFLQSRIFGSAISWRRGFSRARILSRWFCSANPDVFWIDRRDCSVAGFLTSTSRRLRSVDEVTARRVPSTCMKWAGTRLPVCWHSVVWVCWLIECVDVGEGEHLDVDVEIVCCYARRRGLMSRYTYTRTPLPLYAVLWCLQGPQYSI